MLAAALIALPLGAEGVPFLSRTADCRGVATVGEGTFECTTRFVLPDSRFPSDFETHANFHARMADGVVIMEWYDQLLQLQARYECVAPGLYVVTKSPTGHAVEGGPADMSTYPNCRRTIFDRAYFASGVQTLIVTARAEACLGNDNSTTRCPFHGFLALDRAILHP